jgi:hypothetical protein
MKKFERTIACLLACGVIAVIIFSAQQLTSAQVANGARRGFTATDRDNPVQTGHEVFRIDLDNPGNTQTMGFTNVPQELEGFYSIDNTETGRSKLFGVAENCITTCIAQSVVADITVPAVNVNGLGSKIIDPSGIDFGTEAGAAWNHVSHEVYAVASDDLASPVETKLYVKLEDETSPFMEVTTTGGYLDGLAVGGDGTLYATDCRLTNHLYKFDFDLAIWVEVDSDMDGFGVTLNEDSGLANYRGLLGNETNLYMITEGDGANLGRLWTIDATTGDATVVGATGELRLAGSGAEAPEDLEGFDIPFFPLVDEQ